MTRRQQSRNLRQMILNSVPLLFLFCAAGGAFAASVREKVIYNFQYSANVANEGSQAALVADAAGNLYGTYLGETAGSVFKLSPPSTPGGDWTETVLYSFKGGPTDGAYPNGALIFDRAGNIYGTTFVGGACDGYVGGCGTVFELSPPATPSGAWTESVLHIFRGGPGDGAAPGSALVFDPNGNLYGTTWYGGNSPGCDVFAFDPCGSVFELTPSGTSGAAWSENLIYSFPACPGDGYLPQGELIFDRKGALYGATALGGPTHGTIFQLLRRNGRWTENIIPNIGSSAGLTFDNAGNLFGVSNFAGGSVFELSSPTETGDSWTNAILYTLSGGKDGALPLGKVIFDKSGNLYTTASRGGLKPPSYGNGTVFELSPPAIPGGAWTETTLHDFAGSRYGDGFHPVAGLTFFKGKFYGTTQGGGLNQKGTVFAVVIKP